MCWRGCGRPVFCERGCSQGPRAFEEQFAFGARAVRALRAPLRSRAWFHRKGRPAVVGGG
eukprot:7734991-Lingulodinium_polyedra.AAC.1